MQADLPPQERGFALHTLTAAPDDDPISSTWRVADPARLRDLDDLMFQPTGWFVIDETNQALKGVRITSLDAGLAVLGHGRAATIVGRLRPDVTVVDIDLTGPRAQTATKSLEDWCRHYQLWHLLRPSGGAPGRAHLFIVPGTQHLELAAHIADLRAQLRASKRAIDLRTSGHIRPLSAPHRAGGHTRPHGDIRAATRTLVGLLRTPRGAHAGTQTTTQTNAHTRSGADTTDRAPATTPRASAAGPSSRPLAPRPRRRTDLPSKWQTYLEHGTPPAHAGEDQSRSTDEMLCTVALLRAGHSAATAWALISTAHPEAMVRAKASHRRWVAWVWNRAVEDDHTRAPATRTQPRIAYAVHEARQRLTDLAWTLTPRRRRALLLVGHHVLDRMERTNTLQVPVAERDLVQDTCLTDRKTIRAALRQLHGPIGHLHTSTFDPTTRRATSSYEFQIEPANPTGVRQIPPPSSHTPLPRGIWSQLPGPAHALWRALQAHPQPQTAPSLSHRATLCATPTAGPTFAELRTTTTGLTALAAAGLAHCTADGHWELASAPGTAAPVAAETAQRASAHHDETTHAITTERARYRAPSTRWHDERRDAYRTVVTRQRAWWLQLERTTRTQRSEQYRHAYDQLPLHAQQRIKTQLAHRRTIAGLSEADRHDAWCLAFSPEEFLERAVERQHRYASLAPPLQQALVQTWQKHRRQFHIPRGMPTGPPQLELDDLLPHGATQRDTEFLRRQLWPTFEQRSTG